MILIAILAGTLAAGIGSVWLAALLSFGVLARYTTHMLSLAAGALLATAFMHLLPEAFESQAGAQELFGTLLVGLVFFFLLDKAELYHHGHEHHDPQVAATVRTGNSVRAERVGTSPGPLAHGHAHHHDHDHGQSARSGSWAVLTGDSVHAFGDGILIASAFVADMRLGVITALAVLAHEIPHHMGDLVVLRQTSSNQRAALIKVSLAGAVTALGGLVGYALVDMLHDWLPYFLVVASSSFVYVALADLIPQLQKRLSARETVAQIAWLGVGIALVTVVSGLAHSQ
ncbi:MAG: ZIP family metal transporter [Pseudomonadota bacterium]|uniref:ZIP family metal transporter n=1 Tax=Polaromonas sp. TaxID=1869339 RepID=UPI0018141479|nr:ZIP family metal transporter [Polaromonas sp.]MBA3595080.1 ZIP family metal transporter [Polaromonas sp.]MDQ3271963.1 ZIP family metal transporter [Pseudomonadota bacterium]